MRFASFISQDVVRINTNASDSSIYCNGLSKWVRFPNNKDNFLCNVPLSSCGTIVIVSGSNPHLETWQKPPRKAPAATLVIDSVLFWLNWTFSQPLQHSFDNAAILILWKPRFLRRLYHEISKTVIYLFMPRIGDT